MQNLRDVIGVPFVIVGTLILRLGEWIGGGPYNFDLPYDRYHDQRALELSGCSTATNLQTPLDHGPQRQPGGQ